MSSPHPVSQPILSDLASKLLTTILVSTMPVIGATPVLLEDAERAKPWQQELNGKGLDSSIEVESTDLASPMGKDGMNPHTRDVDKGQDNVAETNSRLTGQKTSTDTGNEGAGQGNCDRDVNPGEDQGDQGHTVSSRAENSNRDSQVSGDIESGNVDSNAR